MKKLFLFLLLVSSMIAKTQITLLHTFDEDSDTSVCSPSIIEDAGYYCFLADSTDENYLYHFPTFNFLIRTLIFTSRFNLN